MGFPEVERLDAQLNVIGGLKELVVKRMREMGVTIEVDDGPRFVPSVEFKHLPGEENWDVSVKEIETLAIHASKLIVANKLGRLIFDRDEARNSIKVAIKD